MAIGHAVVHYAQAAHAFSAGIECWHCICGSDHKYTLDVNGLIATMGSIAV